ncbi:hypothetical protein [Sphingomonas sp. SUN039]|uniref:hypothetical protein n=1 Tax=Sphingomonas sp. SUN039 TaxID=2937787 RepID=UPI002164361D|nr:hypothetical protein [Sphingomonas sp. SUN039]UVO53793.1 hypothetical protein M0209_06535 [Sphingomonas sp. SUN039]
MSNERRQRLTSIAAILAVVLAHGSIIAGLAWIGEWRVWRFTTNFIVQLDAALVICCVIGSSARAIVARRRIPVE